MSLGKLERDLQGGTKGHAHARWVLGECCTPGPFIAHPVSWFWHGVPTKPAVEGDAGGGERVASVKHCPVRIWLAHGHCPAV